MSEGNVYLCLWKKRGRSLTLFLESDPSVKVSASNLADAEEKMWELLCEKFGDGEAVLEYHTPPDAPEAQFAMRYGSPSLVIVSGNDSAGTLVNAKELHPKGYCPDCQQPLKTNPAVVPQFDRVPSSDGAITTGLGSLFSEEFLSWLSDEEKSGLQFEPIRRPKRNRKAFFLLVGKPQTDFVGVPGFEGLLNYECRRCHRPLAICYLRNNKLFRFVALADLPNPVPDVFALGPEGDVSLCMTRRRYSQIIGKPGAQNITSSRLWVVSDEQFVSKIDARSHPPKSRWAPRRFFKELT